MGALRRNLDGRLLLSPICLNLVSHLKSNLPSNYPGENVRPFLFDVFLSSNNASFLVASDCPVGGEAKSGKNNLAFKENENLKIITNILKDFERIVGSHAYATLLDDEKVQLIDKIWESCSRYSFLHLHYGLCPEKWFNSAW